MTFYSPESLCAIAQQLQRGAVSPTQVVERCLSRIDEVEATLQAWTVVDRAGALAQAKQQEREGIRADQPLWGIPFGIKDIIDVAGLPTKCGSPLRQDAPAATEDAFIVKRLRQAGAIILGKTVTTEFACFDPAATRNPWNLDRTPGGSSSGSAAAVASGMCVAAIGTQTGGSILRPASYCGMSGLKPAHHDEHLAGVALVSPTLDHVGPLASSVADLQFIWQAIGFVDTFAKVESVTSIARIDDPFLEQADTTVAAAFEIAMEQLCQAFPITKYTLPICFAEIHVFHRTIMAVEAAKVHETQFAAVPERFSPTVAGLIQAGKQIPTADYLHACERRKQLIGEVVATWPTATILALPTTLAAAPTRETTGDPRLNSPFSFLGLPSLTLPCGFSPEGLPLGLQLVGKTETSLLATAAQIEQILLPNWQSAVRGNL